MQRIELGMMSWDGREHHAPQCFQNLLRQDARLSTLRWHDWTVHHRMWEINQALQRAQHRAIIRKRKRHEPLARYYLEFPNRAEMVAFQLRWS